jgi:DtxR family Mn-dependent transcriptional regulator
MKKKGAKLSKSFEDYIEVIYIIKRKKKFVRVKDIAKNLDVSLPSVTEAIKKLAKKGLVEHDKYGLIELTKNGNMLARRTYKKHKILLKFFTEVLNLDEKTALHDACSMEHGLSKKSLIKLTRFVNAYSKKNKK